MPDQIENLKTPTGTRDGRSLVTYVRKGGAAETGLLEWTAAAPDAFRAHLAKVEERLPTGDGRPEEARTLKIGGLFSSSQEGRSTTTTALVYQCAPRQPPVDLREVMLRLPKPSSDDRRALSLVIATQVRSLHVHFQLQHVALRTESFVFLARGGGVGGGGSAEGLDLKKPYILDWARLPSPDMYRHPAFEPRGPPQWFYQVWSLLMILSEIADWRPLDKVVVSSPDKKDGGEEEGEEDKELLLLLKKRVMERRRLVRSPAWKGAATAQIFDFGFAFIDFDRNILEQYSPWRIKAFYDKLCRLLAASAPQ
ncbi:hypothetical protein F4778DRAFT_608272 [Xylariomycetidae sp. FL2044]|nr:hypothetical protein F4778DRAFT_608272 [Xylariomycetidae sp. FL2044]